MPDDPSMLPPPTAPTVPPAPPSADARTGAHAPTPSPSAGPTEGWSGGAPASLPARLGRYELREVLGQGGMGAVYGAYDTQLRRCVALKVPFQAGLDAQVARDVRERFLREARLAATLAHPNLCPVYDYGEIDGVAYLAMAHLEGKPLAQFIRPGQQLPPRAVVAVVRLLALAMTEAHGKGIIHRDLKPANIMITPQRQPVIMDFGLARRTAEEDTRLTQEGRLLGTPAYMAPEQFDSDARRMGPACDIYALGVILYELLTGRTPFQGPLTFLVAQVVLEAPPPLTRWRGDVGAALNDLCLRALAKKPYDRFPTMQAFAAALEGYLRAPAREPAAPAPAAAPPAPLPPAGPPVPLDQENAATLFNEMARQQSPGAPARPPKPPRRRRRRLAPSERGWLVGAIPVLAALLLVAVAWPVVLRLARGPEAPAGQAAPRPVADDWAIELTSLGVSLDDMLAHPGDPAKPAGVLDWYRQRQDRLAEVPPELCSKLAIVLAMTHDDELGLQLLEQDQDPRWQAAARHERAARASTDYLKWVKCADAVWDVAEHWGRPWPAAAVWRHAQGWYEKALPVFDGRIAEAERTKDIDRLLSWLRSERKRVQSRVRQCAARLGS